MNEDELSYYNRCLRTKTGALLFGPAGNRLVVDVLKKKPGFEGVIDFIHKANIDSLFTVSCDKVQNYNTAETVWHPNFMEFKYEKDGIEIQEIKTITENDMAISYMVWSNYTSENIVLKFDSAPSCFDGGFEKKDADIYGMYAGSAQLRFGIIAGIVAAWSENRPEVIIKPNEKKEILAAAVIGDLSIEKTDELINKIFDFVEENKRISEKCINKYINENNQFYQKCPDFWCEDEFINACYKYRLYILKNCICRPQTGRFTEAVMYEGRDHRMDKTPMHPKGWEFSKLIPLSSPLQINDFRWLGKTDTAHEIIRSAFARQNEDGLILCAYINSDEAEKSYANYMVWAVWLNYQIDGDREFIREMLPKLIKYIQGHEKNYTDERDDLCIERNHSLTGKEYQPSYWYFHDFPLNPKDKAGYTPLKRVDRSIYHYLNLKGLSNILYELDDERAAIYHDKAKRLESDINEKMWDEKTEFFYDIHYQTEEKAMVKNIVGIYPYWAEIAQEKHKKGIEMLIDKQGFNTGYAFPTVARDSKVFCPDGGWQGNYIKGRNGCVWCGPSWPYTTGIALEALGNESRKSNHEYDEKFDEFFMQYTYEHFRNMDYKSPYLVEHYNPVSGERLSDEADYNHSFWIDILIRYVIGITIEKDYIIVDPIHMHISKYKLSQLYIRGNRIDVESDSEIMKIYVNGKLYVKTGKNQILKIHIAGGKGI